MSHQPGAAVAASGPRLAGRLEIADYAAPLAIAAAATGFAADQGGYFPTSWGWTALGLGWALGIALLVSGGFAPLSRLAIAFLVSLAGLFVWVALSPLWSVSPSASVLEAERTVVYMLGAAFVLFAARGRVARVYGALLLAIFLVSAYGLGTRLFPDRIGVFDPISHSRLAEPIGYWNGLAIFAAMGSLLAVALAAHGRRLSSRAAAAAALPILLVTQYFTFSRAGWLALCIGFVAAAAFDARRLRLITVALALSIPSLVAVLAASRQSALTHTVARLDAAAHAGHRFAVIVLALSAASAVVAVVLGLAERAVRIDRRVRVGYSLVLAAVTVTSVSVALAAAGGPVTLAKRGYDSFTSQAYVPPEEQGNIDLDQRLLSFSGNGRALLWQVAWDDYRGHPLLGSGAGTFQRFWLRQPSRPFDVHDAHGLYIETLAELGPVGLALILVVLALPLAAAWRARNSLFAVGAGGAYVAFFVHAGVDWDWELGGVTLVAVCCGSLLLLLGSSQSHPDESRRGITPVIGLTVLVPVMVFALIALLGNSAVASSQHALAKHDWPRAEQFARRAHRWMPWSPAPWIALGDAQLGEGEAADARSSYRHAIGRDRSDWQAWFGLARASSGRARTAALAETRRLNVDPPQL